MRSLYKIDAAHQLQAFIDHILTKCALEKKDVRGKLVIPYNVVLDPKPEEISSRIVVKFEAYWDGDLKDVQSDKHTN